MRDSRFVPTVKYSVVLVGVLHSSELQTVSEIASMWASGLIGTLIRFICEKRRFLLVSFNLSCWPFGGATFLVANNQEGF